MTATVALLAALNIAVTFLYQWLPIAALGVGIETDALFASAMIPQLVASVASSALTSVLTPALATADDRVWRVQTWTLLQLVAAVGTASVAVLALLAPWWVPIVVPGFSATARDLTVGLVRIQLLGTLGSLVVMVCWSAHYARHRFVWVETGNVVAGFAGLGLLWALLPVLGVAAAAWALAARGALQCLWLVPGLGAYQRPSRRAVADLAVWRRLLPLVLGALYGKADPVVERAIATLAPPGELSLLNLAQQGWAAANQVLNRAIVNPLTPRLARAASAGQWAEFTRISRGRLRVVLALTAVTAAIVVVAGRPAMHALLDGWAFRPSEVDLLHALIVAYLGLWMAGAAGQVLTVSFYAFGNTFTPTVIGVVGFTIGLPLKFLFFWQWGVVGLAAATSVYTTFNAILHRMFLERDLAARPRSPPPW